MFNRKRSAPSRIICRSVSVFFVAGPSVQMIFVLRIGIRIEARVLKARRFSWRASRRPHTNTKAPSFPRAFSRHAVDREKCSACEMGRCHHVRHDRAPNIPGGLAQRFRSCDFRVRIRSRPVSGGAIRSGAKSWILPGAIRWVTCSAKTKKAAAP